MLNSSGSISNLVRFVKCICRHAQIKKILPEEVNFDNGFLFLEEKESPHQPTSETQFKWHLAGVLILAQN